MAGEIKLIEKDGKISVTSREVAEKFNKDHKHVLRDIKNLIVQNWTVKNMFEEKEYLSERGRKYPEYEMNRDGYSLLVMGFTGIEALEWKVKFIEAFNKMEDHIRKQNVKLIPSTYKEALKQLIEQLDENEKLLDEVDRYKRFLCDTSERLSKTQLATKLDTKPQTLASYLKKAGIYTKTSQIKEEFLRKYPNTKLIVEKITPYTDPNTKEEKEVKTFEWTYEGAKTVVDYLISLGLITYTNNNGFKLNRA